MDELIPIVAIISTAMVLLALIRMRHGKQEAELSQGNAADAEEKARLSHENEALRLTVRRLEERMAVLESIATDPAERTAREIEQLR